MNTVNSKHKTEFPEKNKSAIRKFYKQYQFYSHNPMSRLPWLQLHTGASNLTSQNTCLGVKANSPHWILEIDMNFNPVMLTTYNLPFHSLTVILPNFPLI